MRYFSLRDCKNKLHGNYQNIQITRFFILVALELYHRDLPASEIHEKLTDFSSQNVSLFPSILFFYDDYIQFNRIL